MFDGDGFDDEDFGRLGAGRPAAARMMGRAMGGAMRGPMGRGPAGRGAIPPRFRPPLPPPPPAYEAGGYEAGGYEAGGYEAGYAPDSGFLDIDSIGAQVADELVGAAPASYGGYNARGRAAAKAAAKTSARERRPGAPSTPREPPSHGYAVRHGLGAYYGQEPAPAPCACNAPITAVACFPSEERAPSTSFVDAMKIGAGVALGVSAVALGIQVLRRI